MSKKDLIKLRKKLRRIQKDLLNISILLDNAIDEDFVTAQAYSDMSSDFSLNREKTQKVALKYKQNQETKAKEDTKKKLPEKLPEKLPKLDITNPNWPEALPENFIPRNDEEEKTRADLIISRLPIQLQGKILDFGCGEGFLAASLKEKGNDIIGYDIVKSDKWNIFDNPEIFITDWDIIHNQVFDIIILYDTIDHLVEENIDTTFAKLKSILSEKGTIIIMAHPWTSRHGGHIYKNLNLAYVHLVLDSSELNEVCPDRPTTVITSRPHSYYDPKIKKHFDIDSRSSIPTIPEPWIVENLIPHIRKKLYSTSDITDHQITKIISLSSIFYTLSHKSKNE